MCWAKQNTYTHLQKKQIYIVSYSYSMTDKQNVVAFAFILVFLLLYFALQNYLFPTCVSLLIIII